MEFEERLRLETEGDVYHPDLLAFAAGLGFGLTQHRFDFDGEIDDGTGTLDEYDLSGELLSKKSYPMSFYLDKSEDLIPRQFTSSLKTERQGAGATVSWRSREWPMRFQYSRGRTEQEGQGVRDKDPFSREDERFRYSLDHDFSRSSSLSFDYQRSNVNQKRLGTSFDRTEDTYALSHDLVLGNDEQFRLDSFFNFLDQSGDFDLQRLLWQERMRLKHSDTLETHYDFSFNQSKRPTLRNDEARGEAGFTHRLFQSLVTQGNVYTSKANLGEGVDLTRNGGGLTLDYRKKNRWGTLFGNWSANLLDLQQKGGSTMVSVVDERHPFEVAGSWRIRLDRANVDTSSIAVRSSDRSTTYSDYTVSQSSGMTEIIIIPGDITTDGDQTLSIDYDFFTEPQRDEQAFTHGVRVRERFHNGLSMYYEYRSRAEELSSTDTDIVPDEFEINTFGTDYVKKGLRLLAEYSSEESTRIPSVSTRIEASYLWRINPDTRVTLHASNRWIDYTGQVPYDIQLLTVGTEVSSKLTDKCSIVGNIDYRDEDDTRQGSTRGLQWDAELRYTVRQLSIRFGVEFNHLARLSHETDNTFIYLRLKRLF
ncbi:MAG: hypothetical protein JSU70_17820 [Phycisphaerales bacterium]|nr:MAG: hypothetical protein JSU70_17820 [Phycisphaerales bacterium]